MMADDVKRLYLHRADAGQSFFPPTFNSTERVRAGEVHADAPGAQFSDERK